MMYRHSRILFVFVQTVASAGVLGVIAGADHIFISSILSGLLGCMFGIRLVNYDENVENEK